MQTRPAAQHMGSGPLLVSGQGIYEESSTQRFILGTRLQVGERVFRYAVTNGAQTAGIIAQAPTLGGATTTLQTTQAVTVAAPIGATDVYVNALTTAQAAELFADGWASIFDASATACFLYLVRKNTALATSGTTSYITLYDELHIALTTSDQVSLITNPYKDVVAVSSATTLTGAPMGVPPVAITDNYYFWLQTWGPCAILPSAALDFDEYVTMSDTNAGYVEADAASANTMSIGRVLHIGTASEASIVYLMLAP